MITEEEPGLTDEEIEEANAVGDGIADGIVGIIAIASASAEVDEAAVAFCIWHNLSDLLREYGWSAEELCQHLIERAAQMGPETEGNC